MKKYDIKNSGTMIQKQETTSAKTPSGWRETTLRYTDMFSTPIHR